GSLHARGSPDHRTRGRLRADPRPPRRLIAQYGSCACRSCSSLDCSQEPHVQSGRVAAGAGGGARGGGGPRPRRRPRGGRVWRARGRGGGGGGRGGGGGGGGGGARPPPPTGAPAPPRAPSVHE